MKSLPITWNGIPDTTGYLHTLAKSVAAIVCHSTLSDTPIPPEDIITVSGFAHRMWIAADLCPSAMSIWDFSKQPTWFGNAGLTCNYVSRMWEEDAHEAERRLAAEHQIKSGIDHGVGSAAWDVGGGEWGVIRGYDEKEHLYEVLKPDGSITVLPFDGLGNLDIPILSVLTPCAYVPKPADILVRDTVTLAASHLRGEEWSSGNVSGLAAYPALIACVENGAFDQTWNLDYYLGTYAALKAHAAAFYDRHRADHPICDALAAAYSTVSDAWNHACQCSHADIAVDGKRRCIIDALHIAHTAEDRALAFMETV